MYTVGKKIHQPIINLVWQLEFFKSLEDGGMFHCVKCFREIESNHSYIVLCFKDFCILEVIAMIAAVVPPEGLKANWSQ